MEIKSFFGFSVFLTLILLLVPNNAGGKHLKKERRKNVRSEIESLKKSFAEIIKKVKENAESQITELDGNSTKETTLITASTDSGKTKRKKIHGKRKERKYRRKTYKQGKIKERKQTPHRKDKHIGKKLYERRNHIKNARKFGKDWHRKYSQLKQVTIKRTKDNKHKHIKKTTKKTTLRKCDDDNDCPSKSCCVQHHHRNVKLCRRVGKGRCTSVGKKTAGRKFYQKMKNKMRRVAKKFKLNGGKDKFLENALKEIEIMKKILRKKFSGHKIYGHEP